MAVFGGQAARATGLCPRMTAPVRLWPPELGKASSALGGQERVLSAVGQRELLVRRQRGRRPGAPRLAILRAPRDTAAANAVGGGLFQGFASATSISAGFAQKKVSGTLQPQ